MAIPKRDNRLPAGYDFEGELKARTEEAEEIVRSYLPDVSGFQSIVLEAMNYSVNEAAKDFAPCL